jgi:hypothetical protein
MACTGTEPNMASKRMSRLRPSVTGISVKPTGARCLRERMMEISSLPKSMKIRLSSRPSVPSTPSAPPNTSATTGKRLPSSNRSPTSMVSTLIVGTTAEPVTPCSWTTFEFAVEIPSLVATEPMIAVPLAPVSRTNRNGPWPLSMTGAQTRPMRSRRVGAT